MRVLHVFKTYHPDSFGGIEQVIRQIATSSEALGVTAKVFTLSHRTKAVRTVYEDGIEVHQVPCTMDVASTPMAVRALKAFYEAMAWADVAHYHYPWPFADMLHVIVAPKKPALVTYHSDIVKQRVLRQFYKPLQHRFLSSMQAIVATSPNYVATSETLQQFKDKVVVIPVGLRESSYPCPEPERIDTWRARVGSGFFLFVGMLRYYKGLHILLDALSLCVADVGPKVRVVVVGSGPGEEELRRQAVALKLDNIYILGALPEKDKMALFHLSLGVVLPSHLRSEAYGIALVEGAMCGKPLISTEIGTGSSFVNAHERTGLVVPPCDPQALRQAMHRLVSQPNDAVRMGRGARKRFDVAFTADRMIASYVGLYRCVVDVDCCRE